MKKFPLMFKRCTEIMLILVLVMCIVNGLFGFMQCNVFPKVISITAMITLANFFVLFFAKYVKSFAISKLQERKQRKLEEKIADENFDKVLRALELETTATMREKVWQDFCQKEGIKKY